MSEQLIKDVKAALSIYPKEEIIERLVNHSVDIKIIKIDF